MTGYHPCNCVRGSGMLNKKKRILAHPWMPVSFGHGLDWRVRELNEKKNTQRGATTHTKNVM